MAQYLKPRSKYHANNDDIFEVVMIADEEGNIVNNFGGSAANISIASGGLSGYSHVHKFGATDEDVTGGTVWDGNSAAVHYPYPADGVVSVVSTLNAGAEVYVEGLDANHAEQSEIVAIGATGALTFSRIFRAYMVDTDNDADVTINQGGTIGAKILAGCGQTLMAVYTVPAGKTAYMVKLTVGSDKASTNSAMSYSLMAREHNDGGVFRIKGRFNSAGGQNILMEYPIPLHFPEKTDIRIDLTAAQQTAVSATFDIILVDNA